MANIIWLASYPKSGNTWVRAFLLNFLKDDIGPQSLDELHQFGLGDMDAQFYVKCFGEAYENIPPAEMAAARHQVHDHIASISQENPLVKTHSNCRLENGELAMNWGVTKCAIYIVRNPLDVVVSYADHYGMPIQNSIEASCSASHFIGSNTDFVRQHIGSWSDHVSGWIGGSEIPRMLMRYEDMVRDPNRAFSQLISFLNLSNEGNRVTRAVQRSSFKQMYDMECDNGFSEKSPSSERFFRQGSFGGWKKELNKHQVTQVLENHGAIMKRLGYIRDDGSIAF